MNHFDLSKLGIDRTPVAAPRRRNRRRWSWSIAAAIIIASVAGVGAKLARPVTVETAAVTTAYPSQAMTTLSATGYVVAARKAALASKATGRLEWLGVVEGSKVKSGEVIARLENGDVGATREQAGASLRVAQANLSQGWVELADGKRALKRSQELV